MRQPESDDRLYPSGGQSKLLLGAGTLVVCVTGILALATALECYTALTRVIPDPPLAPSLMYGSALWLWWAAVAHILWRASRNWPAILSLSVRSLVLQIVAGIAIASLHLTALQWGMRLTVRIWPELEKVGYLNLTFYEIGRFGIDFLAYGLLCAACAVVSMQLAAQKDAMHAVELRQQLSAAHLRALQMQLEPHFLFNTLNAITTLVDLGRNTEASETLSHLNLILKATLSMARPEKVSLATELEIIENYLAIQQTRFSDRLRVEMRVDPNALDGLIPCFLLQPIVENAIRHGIAHREDQGVIVTSIERNNDRLYLRVRDNGPGLGGHTQPGHGIGLKNTEERLSHFYPSRYDMTISEPESGGFEVSITIPYECASP
jgi:signal transduction histidine kinase